MTNYFKNPIYWLLPFVPLAEIIDHFGHGVAAEVRFAIAALALIPLAAIMVESTEQISHRSGEALGGLLNATFGNAPELIISLVALNAGLLDVVKASIVGVVLANLLFVLGLSFFIGGISYRTQKFNRRGARAQRSVLMIAAISIIVPTVFDNFISPEMLSHELALNISVAIVLLITYGLNLLFMLKTHPQYFVPKKPQETVEETSKHWSLGVAVSVLLITSIILAFMSGILVGSVEQTAKNLGMSKAFIGVIIIALIGGVPESVAAVTMARKNKLDLTMGIAVGSSIQITLFVAPVLMLSSYYIAPLPLNLVVGNAGIMIVLFPVMIFSMLVTDGRANWFKGIQLLSVYALIALFCYFLPDNKPIIPLLKP
ncbi:MAG: calcium/proton exchanger [Methylococcaceae bacterium]|nr:calcium/proton exchanger [Methylococcaceae bacterium]